MAHSVRGCLQDRGPQLPFVHSVKTTLAPNYYDQETLTQALLAEWGKKYFNPQRILDFQRNVLVGGRHLALPIETYPNLTGFGDSNQAWIDTAVPMAIAAVDGLLKTPVWPQILSVQSPVQP